MQSSPSGINLEVNWYEEEGHSKEEIKGIILKKKMMRQKEKKW